MDKQYDVIVVGAGNGGLVAAAKTAKAGLKTLLLEKHNLPGGCASSFRRGRFEFEPSLHELCSVGTKEHPGEVYRIFDDLQAKVDWHYDTDYIFRVIAKGDNGYDVRVRGKVDAFCDSIEEAVPGSRESVKAFMDLKQDIDAALDYMAKANGKLNPLTLVTKYANFMRAAGHSTEEVMTAYGIPKKAQDIINTYWCYLGIPTDELNAVHFLNMLYDYVVNGAAMPHHRSHELSLSLVSVIQKHGGEVRYNSEVTKFLYDDSKRVIGVVANGKELYAKEVISNIIPHNVFAMSDFSKLPEHDLKLANARDFGMSVCTIYLGLDCTAEELGMKDYTVFIVNDPDPRVQYNTRFDNSLCIVNCLNNVVPDATPAGTCSLFFTFQLMGCDIPKNLKPQDYKKYKNDIADRYIKDAEKALGISIIPHIEEISVATPVTFARYLGTPEGTIYGYDLKRWDNIMGRVALESVDYTIPGLTFCGGHHSQGDGYSSAYTMGKQAADSVIGKLKGGA